MKKHLLEALVVVAFVLSAFLAFDCYLAFADAKTRVAQQLSDVAEARQLTERHPEVFQVERKASGKGPLKVLVQESGARNGVPLAYLAESEKEAGENLKERSVVCRTVNVEQAKLVAFLSEIERRGGGARVKEIRLKPSNERTGVYQEAEIALVLRWYVEKNTIAAEGAR